MADDSLDLECNFCERYFIRNHRKIKHMKVHMGGYSLDHITEDLEAIKVSMDNGELDTEMDTTVGEALETADQTDHRAEENLAEDLEATLVLSSEVEPTDDLAEKEMELKLNLKTRKTKKTELNHGA